MMSMDAKAIIQTLYEEVWNKRKLELTSELVSPSHALHGPNFDGASIGPEAYARQVVMFVRGFPDLHWTIGDTIAEKDELVVMWTFSGTHQGDFMGVAPTHKKVSVDGITVHHITEGKIMDSDVIWDTWGMMQQLGVVSPLGRPHSAAAR
jgi:steroid delta-isomerase-like uncharacterized protein